MACRVFRNTKTNEIEKVLAPNGQPSQLYQELLREYENPEEALTKWAEYQINPKPPLDVNGESVHFSSASFFSEGTTNKEPERENSIFDAVVEESKDIKLTEDEKHYNVAGKLVKRVSDFLSELKGVDPGEEWYITKAKRKWQGFDPTDRLKTEEGELTMQEYIDVLKVSDIKGRMRGNIIHTLVQMAIHPNRIDELREKLNEFMALGGFNDFQFTWVKKGMEHILAKAGTNIFDQLDDETQRDKVASEVTIGSKLLNLGGTMDLLIEHADKALSIIDFKTGYNFNKVYNQLIKYGFGPTGDVTISQRDVAKLQVAMYAFMIKLKNPAAKFRNLEIAWIPNENALRHVDHNRAVRLENELAVIQSWLSRDPEMAEAWKEIQQLDHFNDLFNVSKYLSHYTPDVQTEMEISGLDPQAQAQIYLQELRALVAYQMGSNQDADEQWLKSRKKKASDISKKLLKLIGENDINYETLGRADDIGWLSSIMGSFQDQTSPFIQVINKLYEERKQIAEKRYDKAYKGLLTRLTPVYQEYQRNRGIAVLEKIPITKGALNFINYEDLYDPLYKKVTTGKVTKWVFRTTAEDWAETQKSKEQGGFGLTKEQAKLYKNLADYMMDQYEQFFVDSKSEYTAPGTKTPTALWNRIGAYKNIRGTDTYVTEGELYNGSKDGYIFRTNAPKSAFSYVRGELIPMVPKTGEEIRSEDGVLSAKHGEYLKNKYARMYYEDQFEQWYNDEMILPFKYLPNQKVMNEGNFSKNAELQFDRFMRSMIFKEELDDAYALGKSVQYMLEDKKDDKGPMFKATINFLDDMLEMVIRGRSQRQFDSKLFARGLDRDYVKIIRSAKQAVSAPIMWLKPIQGTANGVFTYMYTVKEGIKGTVMGRLGNVIGIDGSTVDFTADDLR